MKFRSIRIYCGKTVTDKTEIAERNMTSLRLEVTQWTKSGSEQTRRFIYGGNRLLSCMHERRCGVLRCGLWSVCICVRVCQCLCALAACKCTRYWETDCERHSHVYMYRQMHGWNRDGRFRKDCTFCTLFQPRNTVDSIASENIVYSYVCVGFHPSIYRVAAAVRPIAVGHSLPIAARATNDENRQKDDGLHAHTHQQIQC